MSLTITRRHNQATNVLNAQYIKSQDDGFKCILARTPQAAIFKFDTQCWVDANAAGCLILYERKKGPLLGFIIMNRMAVPNWIHHFQPEKMEIQLKKQYLLFTDDTGIYCLWFYRHKDPQYFGKILKRLGTEIVDDEGLPTISQYSAALQSILNVKPTIS